MAKPVKSAVKTVSNVIEKVAEVPVKAVGAAAKAVTPEPTAQMAGQQLAAAKAAKPVAPVTGPTEKVKPKSAVSLGGEDQMAATAATTRRRRAGGMQTRSRGLTGSARTQRKTLLGQ